MSIERNLVTARDRLIAELAGWEGVRLAVVGLEGMQFRCGERILGRLAPDGLLEIPRTSAAQRRVIGAEDEVPIRHRLASDADLPATVDLLRHAYEKPRHRTPGGPRGRSRLDEAVEESFPASDAPATRHAT